MRPPVPTRARQNTLPLSQAPAAPTPLQPGPAPLLLLHRHPALPGHLGHLQPRRLLPRPAPRSDRQLPDLRLAPGPGTTAHPREAAGAVGVHGAGRRAAALVGHRAAGSADVHASGRLTGQTAGNVTPLPPARRSPCRPSSAAASCRGARREPIRHRRAHGTRASYARPAPDHPAPDHPGPGPPCPGPPGSGPPGSGAADGRTRSAALSVPWSAAGAGSVWVRVRVRVRGAQAPRRGGRASAPAGWTAPRPRPSSPSPRS